MGSEPRAVIRNIAEVPWEEPPEHFGGALSKMLVRPETTGSRRIDHRISCYQPMAYVAPHAHKVQEQVYHVLQGEGLMEIAGERRVVRRHDVHLHPAQDRACDLQFRPHRPRLSGDHLAARRPLNAVRGDRRPALPGPDGRKLPAAIANP